LQLLRQNAGYLLHQVSSHATVITKDRSTNKQESPAVADKPVRRESMPKIAPIRRENKLQTS